MPRVREVIKRNIPGFARDLIINVRERLSAPPLEDIVLHDYRVIPSAESNPRLSLVIPSVAPRSAFGGVTTGLDIFFEIGKRTGADLRIIIDDFGKVDRTVVDRRARSLSFDPAGLEIIPRTSDSPSIEVRRRDLFLTCNWWTTLNICPVIKEQASTFGMELQPFLYLIQEYEPHFYPFSSTHMLARLAFEPRVPCWGVFNSSELYEYFQSQGHRTQRAFVFEPRISAILRQALDGEAAAKERRILIYGRPRIPRNCFPAVVKGLKLWTKRYPEFSDWHVVSAGTPHAPIKIGAARKICSLGKLSLEAYAQILRSTAVGLSLMSSPHPSYPPLEMAHFGVRTITNKYANKDLGRAHDNIVSIDDIAVETVADALARACRDFELSPHAGWRGQSHVPSFLATEPPNFLGDLAAELMGHVWKL